MKSLRYLCISLAALLLASCSAGQTRSNYTPSAPDLSPNVKLQMAVGTLNNPYGLLGNAGVFLNVVAAFRQLNGNSAFFHGDSTLSGPSIASPIDLGLIYSYGQVVGTNFTLGEAPAFPGQNNNGGYATGYILLNNLKTPVGPVPGTYTITSTVPQTNQTLTYTASATLPSNPTVLPNEPLPSWASDGKGGGTFTMTNPPGVTESLIFIQAQNGAYIASMELLSPATSVNVPDGTLNVGQTYYVFCLGADYPMIEAAPPNSTTQVPTLAGSGGTADLTASGANTFTE